MSRNGGEGPLFSSDGQWLYFTKGNGGKGLWRMPAGGGSETQVLDALFRYNYAATASGVYFATAPGAHGTSTIRFKDLKTGALSDLFKTEKPIDLGLAVSPDGRWLLYSTLDYMGTDLMFVEHFR